MNIGKAIEYLQSEQGFMMLAFQGNKTVCYDPDNQAKPIVVEFGDFAERLAISEFEHVYAGNHFREMSTEELAEL